jgi:hypothetical protein
MKKIQMSTYTNEYKLLFNNFQSHIEFTYLPKLQVCAHGYGNFFDMSNWGLTTRSEIRCQSIVEL